MSTLPGHSGPHDICGDPAGVIEAWAIEAWAIEHEQHDHAHQPDHDMGETVPASRRARAAFVARARAGR